MSKATPPDPTRIRVAPRQECQRERPVSGLLHDVCDFKLACPRAPHPDHIAHAAGDGARAHLDRVAHAGRDPGCGGCNDTREGVAEAGGDQRAGGSSKVTAGHHGEEDLAGAHRADAHRIQRISPIDHRADTPCRNVGNGNPDARMRDIKRHPGRVDRCRHAAALDQRCRAASRRFNGTRLIWKTANPNGIASQSPASAPSATLGLCPHIFPTLLNGLHPHPNLAATPAPA